MSDQPISPELLQALEQKSKAYAYSGNSWEGYLLFLRYLNEALQRLPSPETVNTCDIEGIDRIFTTELEHMAGMIMKIFPGEGFEELLYYKPSVG